jgi:hypothetical protein
MTHARIVALALVCASFARGQATCPASGLTLATSGGRLGDAVTLTLTGTPSVSGLIGFDLAPGPVATPIGSVCLGLGPALATAPFTLDSTGAWSYAGILPASPAMAGTTWFLQAAAQDASQPGSYALSNGRVMKLRQPRLFFLSSGSFNPPPVALTPGTLRRFDALTETVTGSVSLPGVVQGVVAVPELDWLVTMATTGASTSLVAHDASTLALVQTFPLPVAAGAAPTLAVSGTRLLVAGSGGVLAYQLPSMTLLYAVPSTGGAKAVILPGRSLGYAVLPTSLVPFDLATGAPSPALNVSGPGFGNTWDWIVGAGNIYVVLYTGNPPSTTAGINGVDTTLNAPLFPSPVALPFSSYPSFVRYGPGSTGPSLFVGDGLSSNVVQLSPSTLQVTATLPTPAGAGLELSNGGTEWLFASGGQVQVVNPATLAITPAAIPTTGGRIVTLPSASFNKAYLVSTFLLISVTPFMTDPTTTAAGPPVTFFTGPGGYTILVVD